jgi:hypothetical protein
VGLSYPDLIAWQKAMDLAEETYKATRGFPKDELSGLRVSFVAPRCRYRATSLRARVDWRLESSSSFSSMLVVRCLRNPDFARGWIAVGFAGGDETSP